MLVGYFGKGTLEVSFSTAFQGLGCEVFCFDIASSVKRFCRIGSFGRFFNTFVPVDPWIRKANREMVLEARRFVPDLFVAFGQNSVQAGALAQIRSMTDSKTVFVWPDSLLNLSAPLITALPLYDLVATYGNSTVSQFERLGAGCVRWIALAADNSMHGDVSRHDTVSGAHVADVAFIGQWRPEREAAIGTILDAFPGMDVKIWGPDWGRRCRGKSRILKSWQGRPLHEKEFAATISGSKVNLNIIDDTTYPSANMRFFEIPCAGGLQVCSPCPEMDKTFRDGETIFYYSRIDDLPPLLDTLLHNDELRNRVARNAHDLVNREHTYMHRVRQILDVVR